MWPRWYELYYHDGILWPNSPTLLLLVSQLYIYTVWYWYMYLLYYIMCTLSLTTLVTTCSTPMSRSHSMIISFSDLRSYFCLLSGFACFYSSLLANVICLWLSICKKPLCTHPSPSMFCKQGALVLLTYLHL